jgi:urease accessory protein
MRPAADTVTTAMTTTITTDALLKLMWLASPALPVGGFSYSEGLEAAIESGLANTEVSAQGWLLDQLRLSLARADLPVVAAAFDAWQQHDAARIAELNAWVTATRETSELRQQTEQMGRSLAEWLRPQGDERLATLLALRPAPTWPVAFALAGVKSGAPQREVLLAFAFGWAENMIAAAV